MPEPLKNLYFTQSSITELADRLARVYPSFDRSRFLELIYDDEWPARELKDKMHHTTRCLRATLPESYSQAIQILKAVAPQTGGFEALTFPDYVEHYGLDEWDISLPALAYFTQYGSAEFAIRPFLDRDPKQAMAYLYRWAEDQNPHVRRLASEGCRPRLPWAMALPKFKTDPGPILPILETLKQDPSESVRRSVANNLNDISKDHPELVLDLCERWIGHSEQTDWIVKHACRSLLKAGDKRALRLFGFGDPSQVEVQDLAIEKEYLAIGDDLIFSFTLDVQGEQRQKLRLEYAIDFVKSRGKISKKIFKISEKLYDPGPRPVQKSHSLADRSTRKHYPGQHKLEIILNGEAKGQSWFYLEE